MYFSTLTNVSRVTWYMLLYEECMLEVDIVELDRGD